MMFALLIYAGDGAYYYTPLNAGTLKDAVVESLDKIYERDLDPYDTTFEIAEVAAVYPYETKDHKDFFDKKFEANRIENQRRAENYERETYERLKAKFGDGGGK